jgi:acetyltransferase
MPHSLDVFFAPQSIAVFGATETPGSLGRTLTFNLLRHQFGGMVFPISPHRSAVLGVQAYPNLAALPEPPDLAMVVTPAPTVPDILADCLAAGVKGVIVLSTGFAESGPAGAELERRARAIIRSGAMRVLGMGSFGVACPQTGLSATCTRDRLSPGSVGFLTQSGALLTALLNHDHAERIGCSVAVSVGSLIDISWTEWLDYLAHDPHTQCIGLYMEQIADARSFFAAAREVAPSKPILLVKSGSSSAEGEDDRVFDEACRSNGVLRVPGFDDLFRLASYLTTHPVPRGRRLAILSNARGPAVLAADAIRSSGVSSAALDAETVADLGEVLTARWNGQNPIDVGSDSTAARLAAAAAITVRDPNTDALLVLLAPQASVDPVAAAEGLVRVGGKPVLACWMWGAARPESLAALKAGGIPTFPTPESAVRTFGYLCRHAENLRFLAEIREALHDAEEEAIDPIRVMEIVATASDSGRTALTEAETKELFSAYGLPICKRSWADDPDGAVEAADHLGYPVLVEIADGGSEAGEVLRLRAPDADGVRRAVVSLQRVAREHFGMTGARVVVRPLIPPTAVETAVRSTLHRDLGPVIALGRPGKGVIQALAPLTPLTVREMIEHSSLTASADRGPTLEVEALEQFLIRLSRLAIEHPRIKEIHVPSLLLWERGILARGVRVVLKES